LELNSFISRTILFASIKSSNAFGTFEFKLTRLYFFTFFIAT